MPGRKRQNKSGSDKGELVAVQTVTEVEVLPPSTGVVGEFLENTQNMFRARGMRMKGLLGRINESGERAELLLRMASERMEAAESQLENDLRKEGLMAELQGDDEDLNAD